MIISRSPLRITLGGGGTDLPSYYRSHEGFLIAAAIDKYVYVTATRPFTPGIYLKYSQLEHVDRAEDVRHPIIREAIQMLGFETPQLEISTLGRYPGRHRPGFIRQFHDRAVEDPACASTSSRPSGGTRRTGLSHRDRPARRTDRQAGSVHRRGRRHHLLHVPQERQGHGDAAEDQHGHAVRPRRQPAVVLYRVFAQRRQHPQGPEYEDQGQRCGDAEEPALREGTRLSQSRCARIRQSGVVR